MLETSNCVHGSAMRSLSLVMSECFLIAKFHYTGPTGPDPTKQSLRTLSAKFYYTGPTGPDRTHTDFFCGPGLRETPSGPCGSPTKSVRVRAGPRGCGRARVVEFSLKWAWSGSREQFRHCGLRNFLPQQLKSSVYR